MTKTIYYLVLALLSAGSFRMACGQTTIDLKTQTRRVDFTKAASTSPIKTGSSLPAVCLPGELFFNSAAPVGSNVFGCVATNVWALQSGGGSAQLPDMTSNANRLLTTNGVSGEWRAAALGLVMGPNDLRIDTSVIPQLGGTNSFTQPNTFLNQLTAVGMNASVDFSGANSTLPIKAGPMLPGVCIGSKELFLDTDATPGQQLLVCNSSGNGWNLVGDGSGVGGLGDPGSNGIVKRTGLNTATAATAGTDYVAPDTTTTYTAGAKQTFQASATTAGLNAACSPLPSLAVNGDIVCDSGDNNKIKLRSNGAWVDPGAGSGGSAQLPDMTDNANRLLTTDGVSGEWRAAALGLVMGPNDLRIDTSVIPQLGGTNSFTQPNTFLNQLTAVGMNASVDFSGANSTLPIKAGPMLPGVCIGSKELFLDTDATPGQQLLVCNSSGNGWNLVGDGSGVGGLGDPGSNGIVKRTGLNTATAATAGTDYVAPDTTTTYTAGAKQTFQASATTAGLNAACSPLPSSAVNGDIVCDSGDNNKIKLRSNGAWVDPGAGSGGSAQLPDMTDNANRLLTTDGVSGEWRAAALGLVMGPNDLRIDTSVIPQLGGTNSFTQPNTFLNQLTAVGINALVDFSGASSTLPIQAGPTPPAVCITNKELFLDTDATPGQQLLVCNSSGNGWNLVGDGSGVGGLGDPGSNGIVKRTGLNTATAATAGTDYVAPDTTTTYTAGAKQTFQASATTAGLNAACSPLPSSAVNGDIVCDSGDNNKIKLHSNGAWVDPGAGKAASTVIDASPGYFIPFGTPTATSDTVLFGGSTSHHVYAFVLPVKTTFSKVAYRVSTPAGAGDAIRIGIWNADGSSLVVDSGAITGLDVESTGDKVVTLAAGTTLDPGKYWLAITTDNTSIGFRSYAAFNGGLSAMLNAESGTPRVGTASSRTGTGTSLAFPATRGAVTAGNKHLPVIVFFP